MFRWRHCKLSNSLSPYIIPSFRTCKWIELADLNEREKSESQRQEREKNLHRKIDKSKEKQSNMYAIMCVCVCLYLYIQQKYVHLVRVIHFKFEYHTTISHHALECGPNVLFHQDSFKSLYHIIIHTYICSSSCATQL